NASSHHGDEDQTVGAARGPLSVSSAVVGGGPREPCPPRGTGAAGWLADHVRAIAQRRGRAGQLADVRRRLPKPPLQPAERDLGDPNANYTATAAPLVVKDKVIVGIAGAEGGIRGFLDAYDAKTGERAWRFWTVPAPGEPGSDTWGGESWRRGGGSTWTTGS